MLNISPGSACDVCLEPFGRDSKAPTAIQCGHIFCFECINNLMATHVHPFFPDIDQGAPCPLCRKHFDQKSMTRLHIDADNKDSNSPSTPAEADAKRIHDAFATVAREGITEQGLRQLLEDAKAFLSSQPRDQFIDLRVLHRIVSYLCETKSKLRHEKAQHDKEVIKLQDERETLEKKYNELFVKRREEKTQAMKTEEELRDYTKNLQAAYESMIRHYNFLVDEWQKLTEENERLRSKQYESLPNPLSTSILSPEAPPSTLLASHREHKMRLRGAASIDPETFVISPLPEFTGLPLPSVSPLPAHEVDDMEELRTRSSLSDRARDYMAKSNSSYMSRRAVPPTMQSGMAIDRNASFVGPAIGESSSAPSSIPLTSGLHPHASSRDRGSGRILHSGPRSDRRSSQPSSPSAAPRPVHDARSNDISDTSILSPPSTGVSQAHGSGVMNNRLQDLLQDTLVTASSSLPNMPAPFSSPPAPEGHRSREKDKSQKSRSRSPSRSRPTPLGSPHTKPDRDVVPNNSEPVPLRAKVTVPDLSNAPVSTASSAAQAVEKAKHERRRAEQEAERERRKNEQDRSHRPDSERMRTPLAPGTIPSSGVMGSTVHPPSSYPQTYTASSSYASQRTATGSLGRSASNPYSADNHPSRAIPIPGRA